eukprot:TRINITY_DN111896_c0_g1_i1.p1 TRINITY_DN111896_c0_g1~~TRINITY_DN111896_c0_g1_i1.p1  ORF type:complete len:434 (-),score=58.73 TRINITY_DN111896_c0_g1_i1:235-1536(-)
MVGIGGDATQSYDGDDFDAEGDEAGASRYSSASPSRKSDSRRRDDDSRSRHSDESPSRRSRSPSRSRSRSGSRSRSRSGSRSGSRRSRSGSYTRDNSGSFSQRRPASGSGSATQSPTHDVDGGERISFAVTGLQTGDTFAAERGKGTVDSLAFSKTGWSGGGTGLTSVPFEDPDLPDQAEEDLRVIVLEDTVGDHGQHHDISVGGGEQKRILKSPRSRSSSHGALLQNQILPQHPGAPGKPSKSKHERREKRGRSPRKPKDNKWVPPGWDTKFHLIGSINEFVPRGQRVYFSRNASLPELRQELSEMQQRTPALVPSAGKLLRELDMPDRPGPKPSFITADSGPSSCPDRHRLQGHMKDRDGHERQWNERFHAGTCLFNDQCCPGTRSYFTRDSVFEYGPSQRWRRHMDTEIAPGVWQPNQIRKAVRFPPLGG